MKKRRNAVLILGLIVAAVLVYGWPYLQIELASSAYYTQQDRKKYEYYTPELLKKMPRISDDYSFEFGNVSGPEAHVYTIRFNGVKDKRQIQEYLTTAGYKQQSECDVKAECWRSPVTKDVVTLIQYTSPDSVVVQVYRRAYGE